MNARAVSDALDRLAPPQAFAGDWVDVLTRAGLDVVTPSLPAWRKRRWVLAAAIIAAIVVSITAAFTFGLPILDFGQAQKAPPESRVVRNFAVLDQGAPPGMATDVIPNETRKVATFGDATLWVAPTRQGGFCTDLGGEGGCDRLGTVPLNVSWAIERSGLSPGSERSPSGVPVVDQVSGYVNARWASRLEVRFQDGAVIRPQVVWVSRPIEAGFFLQSIPPAHRRAGHLISEIVALEANGTVVTSDSLGRNRSASSPADAILDQTKQVAAIETASGEVVLRAAPTRYEGRCAWLEFGGEAIPATPCLPKGYENQAALALAVHTFGGRPILYGECGYDSVEFVHDDGGSRTVGCRDAIVFTELTPADETGQVRAIDHEGRPLPGSTIPMKRLSQSPCGAEGLALRRPFSDIPAHWPSLPSTAELLLALHPRRTARSARWWVEAVRCPEDKADAVLRLVHGLLRPRARGVSIRRCDRDPEGYGGDDREKKQTPHPHLSVGAALLGSIGRGPDSRRLLVTFPHTGPADDSGADRPWLTL